MIPMDPFAKKKSDAIDKAMKDAEGPPKPPEMSTPAEEMGEGPAPAGLPSLDSELAKSPPKSQAELEAILRAAGYKIEKEA